jgi:phosphoserine phosphatase RsbU/P
LTLSNNLKLKISVILSVISWLLFVIFSELVVFADLHKISNDYAHFPKIFYVIFFLSLYLFFQTSVRKGEQINIADLLWRVFATGLITTGISLALQFITSLLSGNKFINSDYFESLFFNINIGVVTTFLISTFIVWEKLIFYQKTKILIYSWRVFVYSILATLAVTFFNIRIIGAWYKFGIAAVFLVSIYYSFNLKWVAYLSSKYKLRSILLITLTIAYLVFYIYIFLPYYRNEFLNQYVSSVTLFIMFGFVLTYGFIAVLVLLFNLPTSPVFEKKLEEIVNFQRLSQSYNTRQNVNEIYEILLDSAVSAVMADAAWLEISADGSVGKKRFTYQMDSFRIQEILNRISGNKIHKILGSELIKHLKPEKYMSGLKSHEFRSALFFPVVVQQGQVGTLALLKEINDGFNHEMISVIRTFVDQASISIENHRLFEAVLENERYIKELNIARNVQKSLLPESMGDCRYFDITAFSKSADEVGGDYYDIYYKNGLATIVIADVSGKGTSAAFHMSLMKGIFNSLVQLDVPPDEFMALANNALSNGLDKASFITVSLYRINGAKKCIEFARAGHCPMLFYSNKTEKAEYLYGEGLGLGILRNQEFKSHVNIHRIEFEAGDIILLFTDGITEAKNLKREEFGYERLKTLLTDHSSQSPEKIKEAINDELFRFCESNHPEDDYSMVILKFK